jgi:CheY-like chemotaxis protein
VTHRILMVDDEEDLGWSTARQMARERPDIAFEGLSDPREALTRIRAVPPDLLITDVRMPHISGIELLLAAREVVASLPVIVVTAYGSAQVREDVRRNPAVEYIEKPFAFPSLVAAIDRALASATGFSGSISLPMLPDLIQIYALSMATGALRITRAGRAGAIWFERGAIVDASCGEIRGDEAVYELLAWEGGVFNMEVGAAAVQATISAHWQELLVEGCRRLDEAGRDRASEDALAALCDPAAELDPRHAQALTTAVREGGAFQVFRVGGRAIPVSGWAVPEELGAQVLELIDVAQRIAGGGAVCLEVATEAMGLCALWDADGERCLGIAEPLASRTDGSRFRAAVLRLREDVLSRGDEGPS